MRITRAADSFLDLLPAEEIKSWAQEVEEEETRERASKGDMRGASVMLSSKWSDRGGREARHESRRERKSCSQSGVAVNRDDRRSNHRYRSLYGRDFAESANGLPADHADAQMRKKKNQSCYAVSSMKDQLGKQRQAPRYESRRQSERREHKCNQSDQPRRACLSRARHTNFEKIQHFEVVDRSVVSGVEFPRDTRQFSAAESATGDARQVHSTACPRPKCLREAINSSSSVQRHGETKESGQMPANSIPKFDNVQKQTCCLGNRGLQEDDAKALFDRHCSSPNSEERPKQKETGKRFESIRMPEGDALPVPPVAVACEITSQVEGKSSIYVKESIEILQSSTCVIDGSMGLTQLDATVDTSRDACVDTKKEYEMLASLLLDDSLDIGQEFDVTPAASGLGSLDPVYCSSIFDDELELPPVNEDMVPDVETGTMSTEGAATLSPVQTSHSESTHLPAVSDLDDRENVIMRKTGPPNDKPIMSHSALSSCGRTDGKSKSSSNLVEARSQSRVFVDVTNTFEMQDAPALKVQNEEDDAHRLSQRQRQIDFGKNTLGYERYCELVPRCKRRSRDPQTPNPKQVCSKRSWDGQIRKWRRLLHAYDPPPQHGEEEAEDFSTYGSHLLKDADSTEQDRNQGFCEPNVAVKRGANLTIYDDWTEF